MATVLSRNRIVGVCCALGALVLATIVRPVLVNGQTTMGTISGVVSDPSGAVVPGAQVKLTNESTSVTVSTQSNSAGIYVFSNVLPGPYDLTVAAPGFKQYVLHHVVVYVSQKVTENIKLSVGASTTLVEVHAMLPLVQTGSSSVGGVVTTEQIETMPLNGRTDIFGLLALAPGVQASGANARIGGNTWRGSTYETTDGVTSMEIENTRLSSVAPSLDSIGEFEVIDSTGSAESGPGTQQVIIATKSGTNQFHGTAFEYNQVDALEAANFFATSIPKAPYIRNEFGGSLGGPIKRNKAFFFGSYEGFKYLTSSTAEGAMPTQALLNGDFSGLPPVIDPETGQPFPGNQIPQDQFSSISKKFFPYFATPNIPSSAPAGLGNNYRTNLSGVQNNYRYQGRVDYDFNAKNTLSGRYYLVNQSPNLSPGLVSSWGGTSFPARNQNLAINYTRTISPTLLNLATFGWTRLTDFYGSAHPNINPSDFIPQLSTPPPGGIPNVDITGFTGFSDLPGGTDIEPSYELHDDLTWVKGAHTIEGGFSWLRYQFNSASNETHGDFSFTGRYTGNPFADFLLGDLSSSDHQIGPVSGWPTNDQFGMFIQDSWKATPRFTLNAGVRYDLSTLFENTHASNMANFYPDLNEMVIIKGENNGLFPSLPIVNGSSVGINTSNYIGNDLGRIGPRIGFAYSALGRDRLVVRGGFGMYSSFMPWVFGSFYTVDQVPWAGTVSFEPEAGSVPTLTFDNPFPTGTGIVPSGVSAFAFARDYKYPMTYQWNFTLESQLTNDTAVRATYFGTESEHLNISYNLNDPVPAPGPVQPRRPYQPWGPISYLENGETSNEQALQLGLTRRLTSGLEFQVQYAWTKALDAGPYLGDAAVTPTDNRDIRLDRGNDAFIRQQYMVANYIYDLPFGKGKHFLSTLKGPLNAFLGGWETSGIVTLASGLPYSVTFTSAIQGWPSSRAEIVGNPYVSSPSLTNWFNPAAYTLPPEFAFGDSAPYSLFGPDYSEWDMSILKDFHLNERFTLQFRSDFFNTLNHPSFGNPDSNISVPSTVGRIFSTSNSQRAIQFALRLSF